MDYNCLVLPVCWERGIQSRTKELKLLTLIKVRTHLELVQRQAKLL